MATYNVSTLSAALYVGKWKHRIFRTWSRVKWCVVYSNFSMSIKTKCILHVEYVVRVFVTCCWLYHSSYTYVLASNCEGPICSE